MTASPTLVPAKRIKKSDDCEIFKKMPSYTTLKENIEACCTSVKGMARNSDIRTSLSAADPIADRSVAYFIDVLFPTLRQWIAEIPLHDMAKQRFGNKAFRDFEAKLSESAVSLATGIVKSFHPNGTVDEASEAEIELLDEVLVNEIATYLKDSFGNAQRIDFGTGHELHLYCILIIVMLQYTTPLLSAGVSSSPPADAAVVVPTATVAQQHVLRQKMILIVFWEYMKLMRLLQRHYCLEPAGSHGVWGLDDFHHLPFIFGSAQLIGWDNEEAFNNKARAAAAAAEPAPDVVPSSTPSGTSSDPSSEHAASFSQLILPKHVTEVNHIERWKDNFLYFRCVAWIRKNKSGPFHEHSNVLYNVSGVDKWARITTGMIKMYEVEVMSKFNVVQHFLFGKYFAYVVVEEVREDASA